MSDDDRVRSSSSRLPAVIHPRDDFMRETDARLEAFEGLVCGLGECRILVYGSGANARHILKSKARAAIVGIADDGNAGADIDGFSVCTLEGGLKLEPDTVVIAAQFTSVLHVYQRISDACDEAGITVYDMCGNRLSHLVEQVEQDMSCSRDYALDMISHADVISVDARLLFQDRYDTPPHPEQSLATCPRELVDLLTYTACQDTSVVFMADDPSVTQEILGRRLAALGYTEPCEAILHAETGLWAVNGHFRLLKQSHPGSHILHIGSTPGTDGAVPRSHGIDTIILYSYPLNPRRLKDPVWPSGWNLESISNSRSAASNTVPWWSEERPGGPCTPQTTLISCAQEVFEGSRADDPAMVVAPLVVGFASWLAEQLSDAHGLQPFDEVLFPSRDGFIVKEVYDVLRAAAEPSLLPPSRYLYTSRTAAAAATAHGAKASRRNYLHYLAKEGLVPGGRYALVDFVGAGTLQKLLASFVPFTLSGFYFGSRHGAEAVKGLPAACYFQDEDADFLMRYLDLEPYLSSPEPSLLGFDDEGRPLFKPEIRSEDELDELARVHDAVLRFARRYFSGNHACCSAVDHRFLNAIMPVLDRCDTSAMMLYDDFRGNAVFNPFTGEKVAEARPTEASAPTSGKGRERTVHGVLLDMLAEFDRVCTSNGLRYIATHGTMLGAVRHGGFIPWDDDLDVAMPRADYDRLAELASKGAFKEPYFLQTPQSDPECFFGGYAKLRDSSTAAIEPYTEGRSFNQGIWMDIMPLDNRPRSNEATKRQLRYHVRTWQRALYAQTYGVGRMGNTSPKKMSFYFMLADRYDRDQLCRRLRKACTACHETGELTIFAGNYDINRDGIRYRLADVDAAVRVPFEKTTIPIPQNARAWLEEYYGPEWEHPDKAAGPEIGTARAGFIIDPTVPYTELIACNADDKKACIRLEDGVVGFTAGVFDLFHVGHLNLLEAAKARCDYLRVGVISDEVCEQLKYKVPVIPLEERMRIVGALECVDDVVAIEDRRLLSKVEAWHEWPFDVAFSGDDHADDPFWQREDEVLASLGARIEYLPYTKSISTSALREQIAGGDSIDAR